MRAATVFAAFSLVATGAARIAAQIQSGSGMQTGPGMQSGGHQPGGNASQGPGSLDPGPSPFPDNSREKRNDERQRRLVNDTQRLLTLTSQLKAEVASTGAGTMSPEMLRQMEEIEKLAKSVKDKMRD